MVAPVLADDRACADDGPVLAVVAPACTALGAEKIIRESSISESTGWKQRIGWGRVGGVHVCRVVAVRASRLGCKF